MEEWRFKPYYRPRVMIPESILSEPAIDGLWLLCLSNSQMSMLRALMPYLHRRSTWVSQYDKTGYWTPDNDGWDVVEAHVSELENVLMTDCADLLEKLDDLLTAQQSIETVLGTQADKLDCICEALGDLDLSVTMQQVVQEYLDDETLQADDPYPIASTPAEATEACAVAQLVWYASYEMLTEIVQPAQYKTHEALFPVALALIASWIGTPVLGIPVYIITALIDGFVDVWVAGELEDTANALFAAKEELICALYDVLKAEGTLRDAETAAADVINEIAGLSPLDKLTLRMMYAPVFISKAQVAWAAQTDWATQRVSAGYCQVCEPPLQEYTYPLTPCPDGVFSLTGGICYNNRLCPGNYYGEPYTTLTLGDYYGGAHYTQMDIRYKWVGKYGSGWGAGYVKQYYWNGSTWVLYNNDALTNSQPAGSVNTWQDTVSVDFAPGTQIKLLMGINANDYPEIGFQHQGVEYYVKFYRP